MVKLTTFAVMCKAYGGEPTVDLLRSLLNLGLTGDWLTLSNRGGSGMDFKSFMMEGVDGEFNFLPEGANEDSSSPSTKSVNNETLVIDVDPITKILPSERVETIVDSDDDPSDHNDDVGTSLKATTLNVDSDPDFYGKYFIILSNLFLGTVFTFFYFTTKFPSAKELKEADDCHFMVAHVTPPSWKKYLKEISLEKLYDIHDRAYMRQVILDNTLNRRTCKLMSALSKARASCDAIQESKVAKDCVC
ncbi:hypothetical protein Tco_0857966 [Tanacetum coccineum]|uniref:Uncharacterized protein n=1 Tax=Tanacetum coccineum TaxID=301880 RepID=A0ABQ5B9J7_9ASTR